MQLVRWVAFSVLVSAPLSLIVYSGTAEAVLATAIAGAAIGIPPVVSLQARSELVLARSVAL